MEGGESWVTRGEIGERKWEWKRMDIIRCGREGTVIILFVYYQHWKSGDVTDKEIGIFTNQDNLLIRTPP